MRIGFVGTGVITEAIVGGLLASDFPVSHIVLSARNQQRSSRLALLDNRVEIEDENQRIVDSVDLLFLAVRPQDAEDVVRGLNFQSNQLVCSLIATLDEKILQAWMNTPVCITRAIPLPAVAQRRGVTALYPAEAKAFKLFSSLGTVVEADTLDEFDAYAAASALMGFYFGVMESSADWLATQGADATKARQYLSQVFIELAKTAEREENSSFAELRVDHSTPGGLNQQLHQVFNGAGGGDALQQALTRVVERIRDARR